MSGPVFCGKCKAAIKGRTLNALGKSWHPEHFACQVCQKPITNTTFNEREGQPVCPPCYAQKYCEKCYHCKQPIVGKVIKAMNHSYHEDHFMCAGPCQKPMAMSAPFFQKEGKPYCKLDYDVLFGRSKK